MAGGPAFAARLQAHARRRLALIFRAALLPSRTILAAEEQGAKQKEPSKPCAVSPQPSDADDDVGADLEAVEGVGVLDGGEAAAPARRLRQEERVAQRAPGGRARTRRSIDIDSGMVSTRS